MEKKVSFYTLGCRLNSAETEEIAAGFKKRGFAIVPFSEAADIVYINTCTVTDKADASSRNTIKRAKKISPNAIIIVAGCYAQMDSERIAQIEGIDLILGTQEKDKVFEYLDSLDNLDIHIKQNNDFWLASTTNEAGAHTRAFLKIQDGCNYMCSYCIIPFARGRSRSVDLEQAIDRAKRLVNDGFKEIVLTGINIGEYNDNAGNRLEDLVEALLSIEGLERFRLGSVEPNTYTDKLLNILKASSKFQPYFHIPLQSGDDDLLKKMRRRYTTDDYKKLIFKINELFPNVGIGADVITGYPEETEEHFSNTYKFMESLPLTHFHVFTYSVRKGTTAAKLKQIDGATKKARTAKLIELGDKKYDYFVQKNIGEEHKVLFESKNSRGAYEGYTGNFIRVSCSNGIELANTIKNVHIKDYQDSLAEVELLETKE